MKRALIMGAMLVSMMTMANAQEVEKRDPLKPLFRVSQFAAAGGTAFDFASGRMLDQNRFHETQAMGGNAAVQALVEFGTTAGIMWLTHKAWRKGSKKAAIIGNFTVAGAHIGAGIWNSRLQ